MRGLMALARHYVPQVAFQRWHLINDQLLIFLDDIGMLFHEAFAEHKAGAPVITLIFLIAFFDHLQSRIERDPARIIFEIFAVFSRTRPRKHQTAYLFGIIQPDPLADSRPHGMAHHMGPFDAECVHETDTIFSKEPRRIMHVGLVAPPQTTMIVNKHLIAWQIPALVRPARVPD